MDIENAKVSDGEHLGRLFLTLYADGCVVGHGPVKSERIGVARLVAISNVLEGLVARGAEWPEIVSDFLHYGISEDDLEGFLAARRLIRKLDGTPAHPQDPRN